MVWRKASPPKLALALGLVFASATVASFAPSPSTGLYSNAFGDEASLIKDLKDSNFRVRVSAALALGRSKASPSVRDALVSALSDAQPTVRVAAAAALEALGDKAAVTALKRARVTEKDDDVKAQLDEAIAKLDGAAAARFLVLLGKLQNKSDTSSSAVNDAFRKAAREKLANVPGVVLLGDSADLAAESKKRSLPGVTLDGKLTKLTKSTAGSDVGYAAHVEFMFKKSPDEALKGSVAGDAKAFASASSVGAAELSQLQVDAVTAATQAALKGAPTALEAAAK